MNPKIKTKTRYSQYIYQNELNKAYFKHDMTYGDFKDLTKRTASNKVLFDKVFGIANNPKYDRYQRGIAAMVHKFLDKKTSGGAIKNENMSNKELAEELHKPIIKKFNKRKLHSFSINNI